MTGFLVVFYVIGAGLVGLMGRNTSVGFFGQFLLALVISPLLALLLQFLFRPDRKTRAALQRMKLGDEV